MGEADRTTKTKASKRRQAKLRSDALGRFLDDFEAKHGEFTPEELARATKDLTPPPRKSQKRAGGAMVLDAGTDCSSMNPVRSAELIDEARAAYVASYEQDHGPIDPQLTAEFEALYARATKAGKARLATQPRAARAHYDARKARLVVELTNGVILMLPPKLLQGLKSATASQIAKVEITPRGTGLHWEALDADLSVAGLAAGIFGSNNWMSELARFAGSRTSVRKGD